MGKVHFLMVVIYTVISHVIIYMIHITIICYQPDTYTSKTGICIIQCLSNTLCFTVLLFRAKEQFIVWPWWKHGTSTNFKVMLTLCS